ncbi:hypothetical protein N7461_007656 [Penicillium sp. DV-2018c]|nr:hypothetical protein N7461_007656 [Penicillium sp. DV-2018c]
MIIESPIDYEMVTLKMLYTPKAAIDIMASRLPVPSQDDFLAQSSPPSNLVASNPSGVVQSSHLGSSARQELVHAGSSDSLADWLDGYRLLSHRPAPQEPTAIPPPGVYSLDHAYSPSRNQLQPSVFSPTGDHRHYQTNRGPAQGETGIVHDTPSALGREASLVPAFVSSLFPNYSTARGVEGVAPSAANTLAPRPQEASADVFSRSFTVSLVDANTPHHAILEVLPIKQYHSLELVCLKYIKDSQMFAFSFADIREAIDAINKFRGSHPEWRIAPAAAADIAAITRVSDFVQASPQGVFCLCVHVPQRLRDSFNEDLIKSLTDCFGEVEQFLDFLFDVTPGESPPLPLQSTFGQQSPVTPHDGISGGFETSPNMDWRARINFGYAFVNFVDPSDIIAFYMAVVGKSWPGIQSSEEPVKICYAVIQGKDNLVNRFRNSNVMTRPDDQRPKLFHTRGPFAGMEAPFPPPNDRNKLRRSVANTAQQGVYTNGPRTHATTPRHRRNRPNAQSLSETMHSRTLNRGSHYSVGRSSPQHISTDSTLVLHGNQTVRHSRTQSLFQNVPSGLPFAGTGRSLGHTRGQSMQQHFSPMSLSAASVAPSVRHSWGPQSSSQQPSSPETASPFTWENN